MRGDRLSDLLDDALEVARRAGRVTLSYFQTDLRIETKDDATVVTAADREAERVAREMIERIHPDDGLIGEEHGAVREKAPRRWILDPIDGTNSFVQGVPLFGVMVAVEEEGEPVVGVLHFPALDETVAAAKGLGCRWNGRAARVSEVDDPGRAVVLTTDAERLEDRGHGPGWDRLRRDVRLVRTWGDCYGYALVATGRAEAMVDPILALWDTAALLPIIEEAGGVFTDWEGNRSHRGGSAIATNSALARDVRDRLGRRPGNE